MTCELLIILFYAWFSVFGKISVVILICSRKIGLVVYDIEYDRIENSFSMICLSADGGMHATYTRSSCSQWKDIRRGDVCFNFCCCIIRQFLITADRV